MSLKYIFSLALKKIRFRKVRSLLLILPIMLLTVVVMTLFNWGSNFERKIQKEFIEPLDQQKLLMEVMPTSSGQERPDIFKGVYNFDKASQEQVESLADIDGISTVYNSHLMLYSSKVSLDGEGEYRGRDLNTLSPDMAQLFGVDDFEYQIGEPIPVIIGASSLSRIIYNIGDKDRAEQSHNTQELEEQGIEPVVDTTFAHELLNARLIGRTGTLRFNLLPEDIEVVSERGISKTIYQKASDQQIQQYRQIYTDLLSPYWDVEQLRSPQVFNFEVVGINTDASSGKTFIPIEAMSLIFNQLHQHQLQARTDAPLPANLLQNKLNGSLIHNGELYFGYGFSSSLIDSDIFTDESLQRLSMPGLIVKAVKDVHGNTSFEEVKGYKLTDESYGNYTTMVMIDDFERRDEIIAAMRDTADLHGGFSTTDVINYLMQMINSALKIGLIIISVIIAIIVFILCWGFASDANHEVGLLRAMGLTGRSAQLVILSQLLLIFVISITLGIIISYFTTTFGVSWLAEYLNDTYLDSGGYDMGRSVQIEASELAALNYPSTLPYLLAALLLPMLAAIIATRKNIKTDPLEALKKDR